MERISGFYAGAGPPAPTAGSDGDTYWDRTSGDVYGPKTAAGGWGEPSGNFGAAPGGGVGGGPGGLLRYQYDGVSSVMGQDPGAGKFRLNSLEQDGATRALFSTQDLDGRDVLPLFQGAGYIGDNAGTTLWFQKATDEDFVRMMPAMVWENNGPGWFEFGPSDAGFGDGEWTAGDEIWVGLFPIQGGGAGAPGDQGPPGAPGIALGLRFVWVSATAPDVGAGHVGADNAVPADASTLFVAWGDMDGTDVYPLLALVKTGSVLQLRGEDPADMLVFQALGVAVADLLEGVSIAIPVAFVTKAAGDLANGDAVVLGISF